MATEPQEWSGTALGAEVRILLGGTPPYRAARILTKIKEVLRGVEEHFSLYRESALTRLNRAGRLSYPPLPVLDVVRLADRVHHASEGLFDPTVQRLWLAEATGGDTETARQFTGWQRVRFSEEEIQLEPGMQLTFNGVAQGHAADMVTDLLREEGFRDVLIDTGEVMGLGINSAGKPWRAGIAMPDGQIVGHASLHNRALATSCPLGTRIGRGAPHILNPRGGEPLWQLASVSSTRAAEADALSTAFCLMQGEAVQRAIEMFPDARLEALVR